MYRKLFLIAALAAAPIAAQDCIVNFRFTAAGSSANLDNRTKGCVTWASTYTSTGFSALSITVQGAPDSSGAPGAFGTVAAAAGSNPSTAATQASATFATYFPWMRVNLAGLTGTGSVTGTLYGWRIGAQGGATSGGGGGSGSVVYGPDAAGSPPTQPPILNGLFDGTNVRRLLGTSAGRIVNQPKTVSLALADGLSATQAVFQGDDSGDSQPVLRTVPHLFNGTTLDRARGNTVGQFVHGAVASGGSLTGINPIMIGGNNGFGGITSIQTDGSGRLFLGGQNLTFTDNASNIPLVISVNNNSGVATPAYIMVFDEASGFWDRQRGNSVAGAQIGGLGSGAAGTLYGMTACDSSAVVSVAAGATAAIAAGVSGRRIRVCAFSLSADTAATTAQWKQGTGTTCGTGTANLSGAYNMAVGVPLTSGSGLGELFKTAATADLCLTAVTGAVAGLVTYAIYP